MKSLRAATLEQTQNLSARIVLLVVSGVLLFHVLMGMFLIQQNDRLTKKFVNENASEIAYDQRLLFTQKSVAVFVQALNATSLVGIGVDVEQHGQSIVSAHPNVHFRFLSTKDENVVSLDSGGAIKVSTTYYFFWILVSVLVSVTVISLAGYYTIRKIVGETERALESPIRETVQNEEMLRARDSLARQIAHDLRSPLMALKMVLERLKGGEPAVYELVQGVLSRIENMTNNLVMPAKAAVSAETLMSVHERITSLVEQKLLEHEGAMRISVNLGQASGSVFCELDVLQRVLSNLINNSLEAGTTELRISLSLRDSFLQIEVADNGQGISDEVLIKLGSEFSTRSTGQGIGLSSAKKAIESWGGIFEITRDRGTKVVLTLKLQ